MSARSTNPYLELQAIGAEMDNHESDLYVKATPAVVAIVKGTGWSYSFFKHQTDGAQWIDIPFAYMPYWDKKDKGAI